MCRERSPAPKTEILPTETNMKKLLLLATVLAWSVTAHATIYSTNWNTGFANSGVVPDNNFSGWSDTRSVSTMPAGTFTGLTVDLQLSGG